MTHKINVKKCAQKALAAALALTIIGSVSAITATCDTLSDFVGMKVSAAAAFSDNGSYLSETSVPVGTSFTAYAKFTGGTGPYQYKYCYRVNGGEWVDLTEVTAKKVKMIKLPKKSGKYTVRIAAWDAEGNYASKYLYISVTRDTGNPFAAGKCSLSSTAVNVNDSITAKAKFTGGVLPYTYKYSYRIENGDWNYATDLVTNTEQEIKMPSAAGFYTVRISAWDAADNYASSYQYLTVKEDTGKELQDDHSSLSSDCVAVNDSVTVNSSFTGGVKPYQYKYSYRLLGSKEWTYATDYVRNTVQKIKMPSVPGYYTVRASVKDANGTIRSVSQTLTVKEDSGKAFVNEDSSLSKYKVNIKESTTAYAKFTGGAAPYQYKYSYRLGMGEWVYVTNDYVKTASQKITMPATAGFYTIRIASKDANGTYNSSYQYITVKRDTNQPFSENGSTVSTSTPKAGSTITAAAKFTGGIEPYTYKYAIRDVTGKWTTLTDYIQSSTYSIKIPDAAGDATVKIIAKDTKGTTRTSYHTLNVIKDTNAAFENDGCSLSASSAEPGTNIVMKAKFKGGTQPYTYKYSIRRNNGDWKVLTGYVKADSKVLTVPDQTGFYTIRIGSLDAEGRYASKYLDLKVIKNYGTNFIENGTSLSTGISFVNSNFSALANFSGGCEPYQYKVEYKNTSGSWSTLSDYSPDDVPTLKAMSAPGTYTIRVSAKDVLGHTASKNLTLKVISDTPTITAQMEEELKIINEYRAKAGVKPVTLDNKLTVAANIRAQELVKSQSHTRPDGRSWSTLLEDLSIGEGYISENIAWDYTSPTAVMEAWKNSSSHYNTIVNSNYTKVGIGIDKNNWVQLFD